MVMHGAFALLLAAMPLCLHAMHTHTDESILYRYSVEHDHLPGPRDCGSKGPLASAIPASSDNQVPASDQLEPWPKATDFLFSRAPHMYTLAAYEAGVKWSTEPPAYLTLCVFLN